jgi:putative ABC transport system ATP-binding protein
MAPKVLLADEPTGSLDSQTSSVILEILETINRQGITLLLITHDPRIASSMRRVVQLHDGRIISDASPPPSAATHASDTIGRSGP